MEPFAVLVATFLLAATIFYLFTDRRPKKFPPGPRGLPIFGNAFQLGAQGHKPALELAKTYGDILGLKLGSYRLVFLNKAEDIREAMNKPEFAGRHGYNTMLDLNVEQVNTGLIFSYGSPWIEHRRFTLRTLRDFGFGTRSVEGIISEEVEYLMEELKKHQGHAVSTETMFNVSALNVIWSIVAGERFPLDHPRLGELMQLLNDVSHAAYDGAMFFCFLFPAFVRLRSKFPFLASKKRQAFRQKLFDFLRIAIDEHRATRHEGDSPRDFIDAYMDEVKKNENNEASSFHRDPDDYQLIVTLMDLFVAGGDTTSTTLTWAFFLLALHPQVQEKMYIEIVEVGASNRAVSLADRTNLVYTEAVMAEIFRASTLAPIAVPHGTTADSTFKGFFIPKGTIIMANIYGAHFDQETWGDPQVFRPERFLTMEQNKLKFNRNSHLMPFGVGKRECPGMSLARDEFFLFVTNSIRKFSIKMPDNEPPHTFEGQVGILSLPEPHKIILRSRCMMKRPFFKQFET